MTHETESALRARILELENGNAYLREVMERAESAASAEIAELRAVNSEQADKIVELQTRREEHLRTIAELIGEKRELVDALNSICSELSLIYSLKDLDISTNKRYLRAFDILQKHTAK